MIHTIVISDANVLQCIQQKTSQKQPENKFSQLEAFSRYDRLFHQQFVCSAD